MNYTEADVERVAQAINRARCTTAEESAHAWTFDGIRHTRMMDARAALAAMPDGRDAAVWQPIETAPKEYSFWGWHPEWGSPEICRWEGRSFKPDKIIERIERTGSSGWYSPPSYWQPRRDVPAPPSRNMIPPEELPAMAVRETPMPTDWNFDMDAAPKDRTVLVYAAQYQDLPAFQSTAAWHPDAGWCVDELRPVVAWRFLPDPPQLPEPPTMWTVEVKNCHGKTIYKKKVATIEERNKALLEAWKEWTTVQVITTATTT